MTLYAWIVVLDCNLAWCLYLPYRFVVEFWDLVSLKEKFGLHSHTDTDANLYFCCTCKLLLENEDHNGSILKSHYLTLTTSKN